MEYFLAIMIVGLNFPIPVFIALIGSEYKDLRKLYGKTGLHNEELEKSLREAREPIKNSEHASSYLDYEVKDRNREATRVALLSYLCAFSLWILGLYLAFENWA